MKSNLLPIAATAIVGFGLGWALKPSAPGSAEQTTAGTTSGEGQGAATNQLPPRPKSESLILPKKISDRAEEGTATRPKKGLGETAMEISLKAQKTRLDRMSEALGLSPEQEDSLGELMKQQFMGFKNLAKSGKSPSELLQEAALADSEFNDGARKLLDPEQAAAFDSYRERMKNNEIEANAQTQLSEITATADLSEAQREEALKLLRKKSAESYAARPAGWELLSQNFSVLNGRSSSMVDNIGAVFASPNAPTEPAAIQARLLEAQRTTAMTRSGMMRDILTPAQLSQYSATLQSRVTVSENLPTLPPIKR